MLSPQRKLRVRFYNALSHVINELTHDNSSNKVLKLPLVFEYYFKLHSPKGSCNFRMSLVV